MKENMVKGYEADVTFRIGINAESPKDAMNKLVVKTLEVTEQLEQEVPTALRKIIMVEDLKLK